MDGTPPSSLFEAALITLVALISGLLAANHIWKDRPRPGVLLTAFAAAFFGGAMGALVWCILLVIDIARVNPWIIPFVLLGLYLLMAVHVAIDHFRRYGGFFGALLVGIAWLPLMVLLRRV